MAVVSDGKEGQSVWSWTVSWTVWSHDQEPFSCPVSDKNHFNLLITHVMHFFFYK